MISLRWSRAHCDFSAPVSRAIVISPPRLVWDCDFSATPGLRAPPSDAGSARAGGRPRAIVISPRVPAGARAGARPRNHKTRFLPARPARAPERT